VLITPEGGLKLLDFGLAAKLDPNKRCSSGSWDDSGWKDVCGTRPYAAPEVLGAKGGYGCFAADVWSLGVCLFAMCGGFFPLDEATQRDWRFARLKYEVRCGKSAVHVIHSFYSRECTWSPQLVALVDAMLAIDPADRASIHAVLRSEWLTSDEETLSAAATSNADCDMIERIQSDFHGWQLAHDVHADDNGTHTAHSGASPRGGGRSTPSGDAPLTGTGSAQGLTRRTNDDEADGDDDDEQDGATPRGHFLRAISAADPFDMASTDSVPAGISGVDSSYSVVFRGGTPRARWSRQPVALRRQRAFRERAVVRDGL